MDKVCDRGVVDLHVQPRFFEDLPMMGLSERATRRWRLFRELWPNWGWDGLPVTYMSDYVRGHAIRASTNFTPWRHYDGFDREAFREEE